MKSKKEILSVLAFAAFCVVVIGVGYHLSYPIEPDMAELPKHIQKAYNRGTGAVQDPAVTLFDSVSVGDKEYYLFEVGEGMDLGRVVLEKGLNGRYRIKKFGYTSGNVLHGVVEEDGTKYYLFGGRDSTARVAKITILLEHQTYEFDVDAGDSHFLLRTEIDSRIEDTHADEITFYNAAGEDITEHYDLSGGGI